MDQSSAPPKILIADDNPQNVELLEAYLSDFDSEIRTAFDGEETLKVVEEFSPDLLLLDVMMPRLSGFEVCRKLRANPKTKELLILMVTALNEAVDFERGVQAGTDDFLTKPVNKVELLCRIRSMLRVRHLKTQLDRTLAYLAEFEAASRASRRARESRARPEPRGRLSRTRDQAARPAASRRRGSARGLRPMSFLEADVSFIKSRRARPFFAATPGCSTPRSIALREIPKPATRSPSSLPREVHRARVV